MRDRGGRLHSSNYQMGIRPIRGDMRQVVLSWWRPAESLPTATNFVGSALMSFSATSAAREGLTNRCSQPLAAAGCVAQIHENPSIPIHPRSRQRRLSSFSLDAAAMSVLNSALLVTVLASAALRSCCVREVQAQHPSPSRRHVLSLVHVSCGVHRRRHRGAPRAWRGGG